MSTGKQRKQWNWSDEAKQAHSARMKEVWKTKRRSMGQTEAWKGDDERKAKTSASLSEAWRLAKGKRLLKIGKLHIIWG